jgi:hypothetical protein
MVQNILIFNIFREEQKRLNCLLARVPKMCSRLNVFVNKILACHCRSQLFQLRHIFLDSVNSICTMILSSSPVTRRM